MQRFDRDEPFDLLSQQVLQRLADHFRLGRFLQKIQALPQDETVVQFSSVGEWFAAPRFNALVTAPQSGARSSLLIRAQAPAANTSVSVAGSALPLTQSVGMFKPISRIKASASAPLKVGSL